MEWPIATAKSKFTALLNQAAEEGAQAITRHGKPVAYVLSPEEYHRLVSGKLFKEHLRAGRLDMLPLDRAEDTARLLAWEVSV